MQESPACGSDAEAVIPKGCGGMFELAPGDMRSRLVEDADPREERDNTEAVYQRLRAAILRCEVPAGTPISQVRLARQLGVSRTPLREAMRMLQREELIEAIPKQRVRVAGFSIEDLDRLYAMRISLEALAIRLTVPHLSREDLQGLADCLAQMDVLAEGKEYDRWNMRHRGFHAALVAAAGQRLFKEIEKLSDHAERYRRFYITHMPDSWSVGMSEHYAIFEACRARMPAAAAEQLGRHYSTVALRVIASVAPEYDPVTIRTALRAVIQGS
jgi:DNA-binding GntR family transcriptional regulator